MNDVEALLRVAVAAQALLDAKVADEEVLAGVFDEFVTPPASPAAKAAVNAAHARYSAAFEALRTSLGLLEGTP